MFVLILLFWISAFIIVWAMGGYPMVLIVLSKIIKRKNKKDYAYEPTVTVMVVAHNEEKVILEKMNNIIDIDYPKDKIKFIISSDNSTDGTNRIVEDFIKSHSHSSIVLYKAKERKGKTNAQNEAQKLVDSEILVMTDANSILKADAIKELVASFAGTDISYVAGKLEYHNAEDNTTAQNEDSYWNLDLRLREIESNIQTITAGNGALYACKNEEYYDFDPIQSHDSAMPIHYALIGKRCIYNEKAIAYEKAGENNEDEFKRKVRMNRDIIFAILPSLKLLNIFKYKWFSFFYFGHRSCRYSLWIAHIVLLLCNTIMMIKGLGIFYAITFIFQVAFWLVAALGHCIHLKNRLLSICFYYGMTVAAQIMGVINIITGKAKPTWEKAETTR